VYCIVLIRNAHNKRRLYATTDNNRDYDNAMSLGIAIKLIAAVVLEWGV